MSERGTKPPKSGLDLRDYNNLNIPSDHFPGGAEARYRLIDELRAKYANNNTALQHIDAFDERVVELHQKLKELSAAAESRDSARKAELLAWFEEYYPALSPS